MNQVLQITGASRGIGAATAREAAKRAYAVCVKLPSKLWSCRNRGPRLKAAGGNLNAPWGITKASGNFGDGINQCF